MCLYVPFSRLRRTWQICAFYHIKCKLCFWDFRCAWLSKRTFFLVLLSSHPVPILIPSIVPSYLKCTFPLGLVSLIHILSCSAFTTIAQSGLHIMYRNRHISVLLSITTTLLLARAPALSLSLGSSWIRYPRRIFCISRLLTWVILPHDAQMFSTFHLHRTRNCCSLQIPKSHHLLMIR